MLVAAVQYAPFFKNVKANLAVARDLVTQAAKEGAKLIVLPELALAGYSFLSSAEARLYAEDISQFPNGFHKSYEPISMRTMAAMAKQYDCAIVWGLITIPDVTKGVLHNTQVLMLPNGEFHQYHKLNLWGNDFLWAQPGNTSPPIVKWRGKRIGLLICRDVRDKSSGFKDFYEKGDADIVAFSANFGDGGFPSVSWMDFAKDNQVTLIVSNRYGREQNNNFGEGGICIIEPPVPGRENGKVHCKGLKWNEPCIVYAEVQ